MRQHLYVYLISEAEEYLKALISKGRRSARVLRRARILRLADRQRQPKRTQAAIAEAVMRHKNTVSTICRGYVLEGLETALQEKPRPGAVPHGRRRWALRLLAE